MFVKVHERTKIGESSRGADCEADIDLCEEVTAKRRG